MVDVQVKVEDTRSGREGREQTEGCCLDFLWGAHANPSDRSCPEGLA